MDEIVLPDYTMNDFMFANFCEEKGYKEDDVIDKMVAEGWVLGRTEDFSQNEFLPPLNWINK